MGLLPENSQLLSGLPGLVLADLFANAKAVKLATNKVVFHAGDPGDGCYRVDAGVLKVVMISPTGSERILAFLGRGDIVGELSIFDGRPRSASVVVVRDSALSFLSRPAFEAFAEGHPQICRVLLTLLATRLRETDITVAAESFLSLRGRVARTLLELAENFGEDVGSGRILIHQKIRQSDLGALAGIARETVSRILNDWKRRKLVSHLSGYYCLEDKAQLERQAQR
jgi:CRP/FNR family transcriptional regulator, cyclic AMP receptor protein